MSFNVSKINTAQMQQVCDSLHCLGKLGFEHVVVKKDASLNAFIPVLTAKTSSFFSKIYKPENHRIQFAFDFLTNFLQTNEETLVDPKFVEKNLELIGKIDAYFSTKKSLKNKHKLTTLLTKIKLSACLQPSSTKELNEIQKKTEQEMNALRSNTETLKQKWDQKEEKLKQKRIKEQRLIDDLKPVHQPTPNLHVPLNIAKIAQPLLAIPNMGDVAILYNKDKVTASLKINRNLFKSLFKSGSMKLDNTPILWNFSYQAIEALYNYYQMKDLTILEGLFLYELEQYLVLPLRDWVHHAIKNCTRDEFSKAIEFYKSRPPCRHESFAALFCSLVHPNKAVENYHHETMKEIFHTLADKKQLVVAMYVLGIYYTTNNDPKQGIAYLKQGSQVLKGNNSTENTAIELCQLSFEQIIKNLQTTQV